MYTYKIIRLNFVKLIKIRRFMNLLRAKRELLLPLLMIDINLGIKIILNNQLDYVIIAKNLT